MGARALVCLRGFCKKLFSTRKLSVGPLMRIKNSSPMRKGWSERETVYLFIDLNVLDSDQTKKKSF